MLSYRHSYHAGNHADVIKHLVQICILNYLKRKEKPFCYHDTHAGAGLYSLHSEQAQKTAEYQTHR
nr:23S rRNA (adenine(2030)-N(6))-methyltransferase RlmJ [Rheinheimera sp. KL1]